jgi:hypothetical protein
MSTTQIKSALSARVSEYEIPPIRDALVLGREAPIGCQAMRRALGLLIKTPYAHIELEDEVISGILVRENLLRRLPEDQLIEDQLIEFVLTHIKPMMGIEEVLHIELDIEVQVTYSAK